MWITIRRQSIWKSWLQPWWLSKPLPSIVDSVMIPYIWDKWPDWLLPSLEGAVTAINPLTLVSNMVSIITLFIVLIGSRFPRAVQRYWPRYQSAPIASRISEQTVLDLMVISVSNPEWKSKLFDLETCQTLTWGSLVCLVHALLGTTFAPCSR